jgi:hypothetical protein
MNDVWHEINSELMARTASQRINALGQLKYPNIASNRSDKYGTNVSGLFKFSQYATTKFATSRLTLKK